jgi:hypothetical protein
MERFAARGQPPFRPLAGFLKSRQSVTSFPNSPELFLNSAGIYIAVLLVLPVVVIARIHPHYLAYFNELAGGPEKGYLHLSDSNVDWGQDLPALSQWLGEHADAAHGGELYFSYFGFDRPERWGIRARLSPGISNRRFSGANPVAFGAGTFCFSATALIMRPPWDEGSEQGYRNLLSRFQEMEQTNPLRVDDAESARMWQSFFKVFADLQFDRLRDYLIGRKPDVMIGYSILVYRLSDAELRAALLP